ncbi:FG-GAP-like repeat-containing protein [Streptomyces sp. NPDC055692]|uniref:FG-GAP-like repeat-containing protein n=1 Tax=Streptomyces sp. NPDC055692 TaxID=3155683 RepID=UPI003429D03C
MRPTSRSVARFASALVAAGLLITAVPAAHADDAGSGLLVLTDSQAAQLEQRIQADPYAGADGAANTQQAAGVEITTPGKGSGTGTGGSHLDEGSSGAAAAGGLTLTAKTSVETVRGMADTVQLAGAGGDYAVIHSLGSIQRLTAGGDVVWHRDNASLYADWQVKPIQPWATEPYPARILMGFNAISPFSATSDNGYATGDLSGDGVADVVFTANVGTSPYRPFTSPGSTLTTGTFVTVLDGKTGRTLWSQIFPWAQQVSVVGSTLVVGDQPSANINAPKDAKATLQGFRFVPDGDRLTPSQTWTYATGERDGRWGGIQPLGNGLLAVSWNTRKTATAPGAGHTLVVDTADGSVRWRSDGPLYSRQLRYDSSRRRIIALEQSDATDGVRYELAAYAPADGSRALLDSRVNALPLGIVVGDLKGDDGKPEYAVSEDTLDPYLWVNATTVRVLNGDDGNTELWSRTVKRNPGDYKDGPSGFGLKVADGRLLVSYMTTDGRETAENPGAGRYGALTALAGQNGAVRWEHRGAVASMLYSQPYAEGGTWKVRTVDTDQNVRSYGLGSGRQTDLTPLQGDLFSAQAVDMNGDGFKDVVVGGQSNGLWAYDGPSLAAGRTKLLWKATLPGAAHQITLADTNGDGRDEIVVAADTAAVVIDARTGRRLAEIDGRGQFVRSVAVADRAADGRAEILVPTDKVRAYDGGGRLRWEYGAPAGSGDVVFSDLSVSGGQVFASYNSVDSLNLDGRVVNGVALRATDGRELWTANPSWPGNGTDADTTIYSAVLTNGVFASPKIPYADGNAVVYTWIVRDGQFWTTLVDFRDARTGKLLRQTQAGGLWTLGNWFTGDEGLVLASTASLRTFTAGGTDYQIFTLPTLQTATFGTAPGGRRVVIGGVQGGVYVWDPAVLKAGHNYPDQLAKLSQGGTRNFLAADLDGDGVDEVVGLAFDDTGTDRTAELTGGRYLLQNSAMHQLTVGVFGTP